jgi:hypothetical protein
VLLAWLATRVEVVTPPVWQLEPLREGAGVWELLAGWQATLAAKPEFAALPAEWEAMLEAMPEFGALLVVPRAWRAARAEVAALLVSRQAVAMRAPSASPAKPGLMPDIPLFRQDAEANTKAHRRR